MTPGRRANRTSPESGSGGARAPLAELLDDLSAGLDAWLGAHVDELVAFRRHLHAQPELAFAEHLTTELLTERLTVSGLEPEVLACGVGLTCDVGSRPASVALRADIDALAMQDEVDAQYKSQVPGVAHACGHDAHATIVLGCGLFLSEWLSRHRTAGGVRLIFQPAEEQVPGGALEVVRQGALEGITTIYGLHCDPKLPVGQIGVTDGAITSAADMFEIELKGPGGHTARPGHTVNLVEVIARTAIEVPARVRDRTSKTNPLLVVFGSIRAGQASNVIPTHGLLSGTARTADRDVWDQASNIIGEALRAATRGSGAECELRYTPGIPPVVNEPLATALLAKAIEGSLGAGAVVAASQSTGGDDFAWYLDHAAGSYARLGVHDPAGGPAVDLHAGHFDIDERAIPVGIRVLVAGALNALASGSYPPGRA